MLKRCPFFPNDTINPCLTNNCQFQCAGGCAISLAAYAYDSFTESKKNREKTEDLENKLNNIEYEIGQLKQVLSRLS